MAVIKGDFKYFAYYDSLDELRKDEHVEDRYLVTVIDHQICTDYQISKDRGTNAVRLNNGLYANPVYAGNTLATTVTQVYSTSRPIEYKVGGIEEGEEYTTVAISELFNKMFYGDAFIDFEISDGLTKEVHVKGEVHRISSVEINLTRTENEVVSADVYLNGELVAQYFDRITLGKTNIDVNIKMKETSTISVILRDNEGNAVEKSIVETFVYPIFHDVITPNSEPGSTVIKRMAEVRDYGDLSLKLDLNGTCAFVAIPIGSITLDRVKDENDFNVKGIFSSYYITIQLGEDNVEYMCYTSKALTVDNFEFVFSFEEVV